MIADPLIFAGTSDFAGKVRGKAFPASDLNQRLQHGVGWTPTNVQITCFDRISETPFGALGDLLLIPDSEAAVEVDFGDGGPKERFMLGDVTDLDGAPWSCCTRSILKSALARLKRVAGVDLLAAFEHEFQIKTASPRVGEPYTLSGFARRRAFGETLMAVLNQAGLRSETFMKEYGPEQYEITNGPALGHRSADHAAILRELVRMTGDRFDEPVTFAPILDPESVGNGVHIHMSLIDTDGIPAAYDPGAPFGMSELAGAFVAGVLKFLDSILALTAPSVISYLRLTPHRWSAAYNNLGFRDREAAIRICPVTHTHPDAIASQFNFEFRAADAAASPHLALAAIVHAGAQGIEDALPTPAPTQEDLARLDTAELAARGYVRLPQSLDDALGRFSANDTVRGWFPDDFARVYIAHKRGELEFLSELDDAAKCARYAEVY